MPIFKRCSRCGRRLPAGSTCPCLKRRHQEYDRYSRDKKSKDFYSGKEWEIAREAALDADGGIDVYLYMTQDKVVVADSVHHIAPLKDDWSLRAELTNLISLHHDTHSQIEAMYKRDKAGTQAMLRKILEEYRRGGAV